MQSKNAIGNLINRYKAVLKKCSLMNTFGSLAVASMLVMGGAGMAGAAATTVDKLTDSQTIVYGEDFTVTGADGSFGTGDITLSHGGLVTLGGTATTPENTTVGNLLVTGRDATSGDESILVVKGTSVTATGIEYGNNGIVKISDGATFTTSSFTGTGPVDNSVVAYFYVGEFGSSGGTGDGHLVVNGDANVTDSQLVIGSGTAQVSGDINLSGTGGRAFLAVGNAALDDATVTVDGDINMETNQSLQIYSGSLTAENLTSTRGNGNIYMREDGANDMEFTINDTISLSNGADMRIEKGVLNVGTLDYDENARIRVSVTGNAATVNLTNSAAFDVTDFVKADTDGKINIYEQGSFGVDGVSNENPTLTLNSAAGGSLDINGTIHAENLTVNSSTGAFGIISGTINLIDDKDTSKNQTLTGSLGVLHSDAEVLISGGAWEGQDGRVLSATDGGTISIDGSFQGGVAAHSGGALNVGGSLNATSLEVGIGSTLNISGGSLTADMEAFGAVSFTGDVASIDEASAGVAVNLSTDAKSLLTLNYDGTLTEAQFKSLLGASADSFFADSTQGKVQLTGYTTSGDVSYLSFMSTAKAGFMESIGAGDYTVGALSTFSHITEYDGNSNSSITGRGSQLTLTGAATDIEVDADGNKILSPGDITVGSGSVYQENSVLNIGQVGITSGNSVIEGALIANGSGETTSANNLNVNVAGTVVDIKGGVTFTEGADLNILSGGIKTTTMTASSSEDNSFIYVGKNGEAEASLDAEEIVLDGNGRLMSHRGTVTTEKLTLNDKAGNYLLLGFGSHAGNIDVTGTEGVNITNNAQMTIINGELTAKQLTVGAQAEVEVRSQGLITIDGNASYAASQFAAANADGKIALEGGGQFQVLGDLSLTGGGSLTTAGTISATGLTLGGATTLAGGNLELESGGTGNLTGALSVNNASSSLTINSGAWTADSRITVTNGELDINQGASLDAQAGLTMGTEGMFILDGTLSADLADFGTVDISNNTFTKTTGGSFTASSFTILNLYADGVSGTSIEEDALNSLEESIANTFFGSSFGGEVNLYGYDVNASTLSGVQKLYENPTGTIGAGDLRYADSAGKATTFGGITGTGPSTIVGAGVHLTLTGNATGDMAGIMSQGDIIVGDGTPSVNGQVLTLGVAGVSPADTVIQGKLEALGTGDSTAAENIQVEIAGTHVDIKGGVKLTEGADLEVMSGAALTTTTIEAAAANNSFIYVGDNGGAAATLTADEVKLNGRGRLSVRSGTLTTDKLTFGDVAGNYVLVGSNGASAELTVTGAEGITLTSDADFYLNSDSTVNTKSFTVGAANRLSIGGEGKLNITQDATYDVADFAASATDGKIAITTTTGSFNVDGTLTLNGGGDLITKGTLSATALTLGTATTLAGGDLELKSGGTGALSGLLSVNNATADSTLKVSGGTWTADSRIAIVDGNLSVAAGANLDAQAGLTIGPNGAGTVEGTLSAKVSDFGSVDITNNTFNTTTASVSVALTGVADTVLNLYASGVSSVQIDELSLDALKADIAADIFGAGFTGEVNLFGYDVVASTLSGVQKEYNSPTETLGAGDLRFVGTTIVGGLTDVTGTDSTIEGAGVNLTLTGAGAAAGVMSAGDITVGTGLASENGQVLTLGVAGVSPDDTTIQGKLEALGTGQSSDAKNVQVEIAGTHVNIAGGVKLTEGADLEVMGGAALTTTTIEAAATSNSFIYVGDNGGAAATLTADEVKLNGRGRLMVRSGDLTTEKLTFEDVAGNYALVGSNGASAELTVTGAEGITLTNDADFYLTSDSTVNTASFTVGADNRLSIGGEGKLNITQDATYDAADFAASAADGKIAITTTTGSFNVDGTLTLNGGGDLATKGTISAKGFTLGGATNLTGGNLALTGDTTASTQAFSGAFTVNNAASTVTVSGGAWTTDAALTVTAGVLNVESGSLTTGGAVSFGDDGTLKVASGATLDVSGDDFTTNVANFGSIAITEDFMATFTEDATNVAGTITGDATTTVVLNNYGGSGVMLSQSQLDALYDSLSTSIFGDDTYAGQILVSGISLFQTLDSFTTSDKDQVIGAGTLTAAGNTVFAGILDNRDGTATSKDSIINTTGSLSLSGNGPVALSEGSITVTQGSLNLGYDGTAATAGGEIAGALTVNDDITTVYGTTGVTVKGLTKIAGADAELEVDSNATFNAEGGLTVTAGNVDNSGKLNTTNIVVGGGAGASEFLASNNSETTADSLSIGNNGSVSVNVGKFDVDTVSVTGTGGFYIHANPTGFAESSVSVDGADAIFDVSTNVEIGELKLINDGAVTVGTDKTLTVNSSVALAGNVDVGDGTLKATGFSNTATVNITGGTVDSAGTWTAGADVNVSTGGLLVSAGTVDVSAVNLTAGNAATKFEVADGATLKANIDSFGSIDAQGDFTIAQNMNTQLDLNTTGELLLTGLEGTTMTKAAQVGLYRDADFAIFTTKVENIELNEVTFSGLYSLSLMIDGVYDEAVMAGAMDYVDNTAATFTGIVKDDTDPLNPITNSSIASGKTLTLTGVKKDGTLQALLDEGSVTNSGTLNLGSAGVASATFNGALTTAATGVTNVYSSITPSGAVEVQGTGELSIFAGSFNATAGLTTADGSTLSSAKDTTLTVGIGTIGDYSVSGTSGDGATVNANTDVANLEGKVLITGLAEKTYDFADPSSGDEAAYIALSDAAKLAYGDTVDLTFNGVSFNGVSLTLVGDEELIGFGSETVSLGSGLADGKTAVVGAVSGDGSTALNVGDKSHLIITGNSAGENGGMLYAGDINVKTGGTADLGDGTVGGALEVENNGTANIIGTTTVTGTTTLVAGSTLNVGNVDTQGIYSAQGETVLAGGTVYADPSWITDPDTGLDVKYQDANLASQAAFAAFGASGIDGNLVAGQNSQIALGTGNTSLLASHITQMGQVWGSTGITAALGIYAPQNLDATTGAIVVNGNLTAASNPTANTANFADNSLLVVDANGVGTTAALNATGGTLDVADTAKLHIVDGKDKQVVTVVSGFTTNTLATNAWGGDTTTVDPDLISDNLTLSSSSLAVDGIEWDAAAGDYKVTLKVVFDPAMYAPFMATETGTYLDNMISGPQGVGLWTGDNNPYGVGHMFLSRALTEDVYGMGLANTQRSVATIEGAAQLGAVANVASNTMNAAEAAGGAIWARNSLTGMGDNASKPVVMMKGGANGGSSLDGGINSGSANVKSGMAAWLMPLYKWNTGNGFSAGNLEHGYEGGLGGIAFGADYTHGLSEDSAVRFGLALNVGAGYSESSGDFNETSNSFDFWGLSAYGALQKGNFVGTLDVGFSSVSSEISQDLPSTMGMGNLDTNISSLVFTAGLNLEYTFATEFMNITPHVGVRFMNVSSQEYDINSSAGLTGMTEEENQSVWYFPVGVTFSKDIVTSGGWTFTPKLDVGFIAAAGDLDARSSTTFTGVPDTLELEMQNVDGFAFNGGAGFELSNAQTGVSVGLNYNLQLSEHETGHMIFANFKYEF